MQASLVDAMDRAMRHAVKGGVPESPTAMCIEPLFSSVEKTKGECSSVSRKEDRLFKAELFDSLQDSRSTNLASVKEVEDSSKISSSDKLSDPPEGEPGDNHKACTVEAWQTQNLSEKEYLRELEAYERWEQQEVEKWEAEKRARDASLYRAESRALAAVLSQANTAGCVIFFVAWLSGGLMWAFVLVRQWSAQRTAAADSPSDR